ncbi:MAG: CoA-binding domain protein [Ignavibacteria bacterium]|nr:MAG: CoA-binding domain protein [Ignavibacteria bacterium]KAF0160323.1 MAG: CoA-binding domain protein [Ignavibacteria bacterium]
MKQICDLLHSSKTIAVVGLSDNPDRVSYQIAEFIAAKGYKVVGVNPLFKKAGAFDVYASLKEIPFAIDIVNVFRRSETIPEIIEDVLAVNPKALWLQQGVRNDAAVNPVVEKGIQTFQDKCIAVYYTLCKAI